MPPSSGARPSPCRGRSIARPAKARTPGSARGPSCGFLVIGAGGAGRLPAVPYRDQTRPPRLSMAQVIGHGGNRRPATPADVRTKGPLYPEAAPAFLLDARLAPA